uniref:Uncharacterized protein n=1 Tax=Micrurus spixii TaxID=129469 RepID=A0A2D4MV05_9SAUR
MVHMHIFYILKCYLWLRLCPKEFANISGLFKDLFICLRGTLYYCTKLNFISVPLLLHLTELKFFLVKLPFKKKTRMLNFSFFKDLLAVLLLVLNCRFKAAFEKSMKEIKQK